MAPPTVKPGFHHHELAEVGDATMVAPQLKTEERFTYTFHHHFHPLVGDLLERLSRTSIEGFLDPEFHESLRKAFFEAVYDPDPEGDRSVEVRSFDRRIDVRPGGAYTVYNWELLFHVPFSVAVHLSRNQRFAEAQRWFHYIFDPTNNDRGAETPRRFWRFLAFRDDQDPLSVDELLRILSLPEDEADEEELELKKQILDGYEAVRENPFQPHAVARSRPVAYRYAVVMKYLDNLIAWGDSLFRQDTIETINEATQIYVLAANILGPRPQRLPRSGKTEPRTFAQLRAGGLDEFSNALVELEGQFPFNLYVPDGDDGDTEAGRALFGIGRTLYFCVPRNEKLLGYWTTVEDRLFKIRHCMNIAGVVRQLPLFEPPLDPGMLVKAAAAGIDIGSLVSGLNQPTAPVRSRLLIGEALKLTAEVRAMGSSLLSALEKQDAEALSRLRQEHERKIQQLSRDIRYVQWKEAEEATRGLFESRRTALERLEHYRRLLGIDDDLPELGADMSEVPELTEETFDEAYEELVGRYAVELSTEDYPALDLHEEGRLYLNLGEYAELNVHMPAARKMRDAATAKDELWGSLGLLPNLGVDFEFWGIGGHLEFGGPALAQVGRILAGKDRAEADKHTFRGARASKTATYERRVDDWVLRHNLAAREVTETGRRILASRIREQIARNEYETAKERVEQTREIDEFLQSKFTGEQLYGWMQGELSKLYYEYYKLAFDVARRAEQTMKRELMRPELDDRDFIQFDYWDGGRKGLLSGDKLHLDLKRMEMAYHDHNRREYELTRHVSLLQVDPTALLSLRTTGSCTVSLPEALFDMDGPGHYFRRIKTVALSLPSVTGPHASVNCTLTLLKSSIRTTATVGDGDYARSDEGDDDRFVDIHNGIQSTVTSSGRNDSGLFETNLRDERFLPFEGAGAVSEWRLELPSEVRQFDYDTISDVVLHLRYTAREGGAALREAAVDHLESRIEAAESVGSVRLFSVRHDFPTEWARFRSVELGDGTTTAPLTIELREEHYPFWSHQKGRLGAVRRADLFAKTDANQIEISGEAGGGGDTDILVEDAALGGLLAGRLENTEPDAPTGPLTLHLDDNSMDDLWLTVTWGKDS